MNAEEYIYACKNERRIWDRKGRITALVFGPVIKILSKILKMFEMTLASNSLCHFHYCIKALMDSLELFSGIGGLALGLEAAGFRHLEILESDSTCIETLRQNIDRDLFKPTCKVPVANDVRKFSFRKYEGKVTLLSGGPPCQPFSFGGSHKAASDNRNMFPEAIRAVREVKPKAFVFENVPGIMRPKFRNYFEFLRLSLTYPEIDQSKEDSWETKLAKLEQHHTSNKRSEGGYRVLVQSVNAADYGVPQSRQRVFMVGIREDVSNCWNFPPPTHSAKALELSKATGEYFERHQIKSDMQRAKLLCAVDHQQCLALKPWVTLRDAISDLPDPEINEIEMASDHRFRKGARIYKGHTGSKLDLPSKTLKAGVNGVPGGENMIVKDDGSVRYLTIRECARVQTFPDEFIFHEIWSRAVRQLGNAVPVKLAEVIGESLRKALC